MRNFRLNVQILDKCGIFGSVRIFVKCGIFGSVRIFRLTEDFLIICGIFD